MAHLFHLYNRYTKDSKVLGKKERLKMVNIHFIVDNFKLFLTLFQEMAAVKQAEEEAMARAL